MFNFDTTTFFQVNKNIYVTSTKQKLARYILVIFFPILFAKMWICSAGLFHNITLTFGEGQLYNIYAKIIISNKG